MLKEYKTIKEVVGPLMLVEGVDGASYDELVEITQANGEVRRGKVLEVNGDRALVQLFEGTQGLKISTAKARFLGRGLELGVGMNTPGIIKYPFWQMTCRNKNARYACVNLEGAYAPEEIKGRSACIAGDIGEVLEKLL